MSAGETDHPTRLDRQWDSLFPGAEEQHGHIDLELAAVLRRVQVLAARPAPDPSFVRRLRYELLDNGSAVPQVPLIITGSPDAWNDRVGARHAVPFVGAGEGTACRAPTVREVGIPSGGIWDEPSARPWWQRLESAAALLVIAVLVGYLAVADQGRRVSNPPRLAGIEVPPVAMSSVPVGLRIAAIGVDAPIERLESVPDPVLIPAASEPWVVAWRTDSAMPGAGANVVLDGHLDYWSSGPAVFWDLDDLTVGDRIEVRGANRAVFSYAVEWLRRYPLEASEEQTQEILGATSGESLTLITDAGEFDTTTSSYSEVLVVRARFESVSSLPILAVPGARECRSSPRTIDELNAAADAAITRADTGQVKPGDIVFLDTSASSEITAGVIAAERRLVACLNANDALRAYALYTNDGLVRLMEFASGGADNFGMFEWTPDFSEIALPSTPMPGTERFALLAVENVSLLEDGRVMATVTIGSGSSGMFGVPTGVPVVHIFERGERYVIDDFFVPGLGTPTP